MVFRAILESKNAMIESPTGTGKTLALLTSVFEAVRYLQRNDCKSKKY